MRTAAPIALRSAAHSSLSACAPCLPIAKSITQVVHSSGLNHSAAIVRDLDQERLLHEPVDDQQRVGRIDPVRENRRGNSRSR